MAKYTYSPDARAAMESLEQPLGVFQVVDGQIRTLLVSDGFCRLLGYERREDALYDMEHDMYKDTHPDDRERIADAAERFIYGGQEYDVVFRTRAGMETGWRVIHAHGRHLFPEEGVRIAHVWYMDEGAYTEGYADSDSPMNQVLNSALHEESILRATRYDELTGLPNLAYFFKLCEEGKARLHRKKKQGVLIYMDLNGMKYFNHRFGFAQGDRLLKAFAEIVGRVFGRDSSCHIGADRFAAKTSEEMLESQIEQLFAEAARMNDGKVLPVRMGTYSTGMEDVPVSTAYDRAKMACDALRKTDTSACNHYSAKIRDTVKREQYIVANIERAIREKWIQVYYQPIVRAVNESVCDEEALARWMDPVEGFLAPDEFIPQLENAGLIYKLDLYMLEQVLEKMQGQQKTGAVLIPCSINLSRIDFDTCDIVEEIRERVDRSGISRGMITIEITESVIGSDFNFMKEQIERFRKLGFPVWMDDFGSGYSSLDVLQSIQFDLIKFDMSFTRKLGQGESARIILTELVKMAMALGVDTLCEGVETEEQYRFLQMIGCAKLQGYYVSRPLPIEQLIRKGEEDGRFRIEDPGSTAYYEAIGTVDLYNAGSVVSMAGDPLRDTFDTIPMGVIEIRGDEAKLVRSNPAYQKFIHRFFCMEITEKGKKYGEFTAAFMADVVRQCTSQEGLAIYNEKMPDGSVVHSFARRVAVNPQNGNVAIVVAVLSISAPSEGESEPYKDGIYSRLAALSGDYLALFTVDPETEAYRSYPVGSKQQSSGREQQGERFFRLLKNYAREKVAPEDLDRFTSQTSRKSILQAIQNDRIFSFRYRMKAEKQLKWVRLKAAEVREEDGNKLLIGIMDIDAQVRRDAEYERTLMAARAIAYRDALTGVKNKLSYQEAEAELNRNIAAGKQPPFVIALFDVNNLKTVNDEQGHQSGDKYLRVACRIICNVFKHSPVFRIGGDEFLAVAQGQDEENAEQLIEQLEEINRANRGTEEPVIAAGMARYSGEKNVAEVFRKADEQMYIEKKRLKG